MATRAKFWCTSIEDFGGTSKKVKLSAVYDPGADNENGGFTKATPWGELQMSIDNPAASCQFELGKMYYLDIHQVPE